MGPDFATRSYSISLNVVLLSPLHRESPFSGKRNRCFEIEQTLGFEGQKSAYSTSNDEQEGNVLPGNQFLVCKIGFYVLRYTYEVNFKLAWFENRLFVYHGYANPRPDAEIAGAGEISWCPPVSRSAAPAYQRLTSVASAFFPRPTGLDDVVMSRRGKDVRNRCDIRQSRHRCVQPARSCNHGRRADAPRPNRAHGVCGKHSEALGLVQVIGSSVRRHSQWPRRARTPVTGN
jgi:hypothetical protein